MRDWRRRSSAVRDQDRLAPETLTQAPNTKTNLGRRRPHSGGVTRVYGEGPCPATSGWRQDAHCRRPRESKAARRKGRRQQPDIFAGERYAAKPKQRRGGDGGAGVVAALVSQISGAPTRTAKRVPVECAGRKKGEAKIRGPPSERAVRVYRRWL